MSPLSNKERMQIQRHEMPAQEPEVRAGNFEEVALGYAWEDALAEAERCLQCAKPHCVDGCPVGVQIPQFIKALREGDLPGAVDAMKVKNNLPAICGRVCPQESQCEANCIVAKKGQSVAIGRLERYVGDYALAEQLKPEPPAPPTGRKVAVVGSGPAGLTCAVDLAKLGHKVTIFESLHVPGGVLVYGIPEFRLPKSIIRAEIQTAADYLGIEIRTDHVIGNTYTLDELLNEYDAIFMGTGAGLPSFMRIPGINLNGVMSANEFLTRVNLMKGYRFPEYDTPVKVGRRVAVVGAGNVAMDAARSSLRLQTLQWQREQAFGQNGHDEAGRGAHRLPPLARRGARARGRVPPCRGGRRHLRLPDQPGGDPGRRAGPGAGACAASAWQLGEPDASGRRSPIPIEGSEFEMEMDTVIFALGTSPNPIVFNQAAGLQRTKHGTVVADEATGRTKKPGVWAGGDVVTGAATVISAMGAGKRAAADMHTVPDG